jgi:hypothetical protein
VKSNDDSCFCDFRAPSLEISLSTGRVREADRGGSLQKKESRSLPECRSSKIHQDPAEMWKDDHCWRNVVFAIARLALWRTRARPVRWGKQEAEVALSHNELGGPKRHDLTVCFLVGEAEIRACAANHRQLCIIAEQFLRHMHLRGFRPRIFIECRDGLSRLKIERYLHDVIHELDSIP